MLLLVSQVYYWRERSQLRRLWVNRAMQSRAFPNNDPEPSGIVTGLFPYSNYRMYIVVANNRYEGPPSNYIHFSTPEGGKKFPSEEQEKMCVFYQGNHMLMFISEAYGCCFLLCFCPQYHLLPDPSGYNSDIWTAYMSTGTCRRNPTVSLPDIPSSTRQVI